MRRHLQIYGSAIVQLEASESPNDGEQHGLVPCEESKRHARRQWRVTIDVVKRHKASMMNENTDASMNRNDQQTYLW